MIEKIITSKTHVKLLILFLTHIDDRYYLRELERKLDESLSPLRRQLMKLEKMGILVTEEEANLKYYRLNKNFTGMEELRRLVLGKEIASSSLDKLGTPRNDNADQIASPRRGGDRNDNAGQIASAPVASRDDNTGRKRTKYDIAILTTISLFVLAVAAFMVYTNTKNIEQVASLVSEKAIEGRASSAAAATRTRPDEMISRRWKLLPGNVPVLSSGETGGKRSEEL